MSPAIQEMHEEASDLILDEFEAPVATSAPTPAKKKDKRLHQILVILCYAASAACLYFVFRQVEYKTLVHAFSVLQPGWLLLAMLGSMVVYLANTIRWSILTGPLLARSGKRVGFWRTLQAVYIGLFFNEVLPLRPGEVIRCYLFSRWNGLALSATFASAILERILDGVWLLAGFFVVAVLIHLPRGLMTGAAILLGFVIAGMAAWLWLAQRAATSRKRNLGTRRGTGIKADILEALEITGRPRALLAAGLASCMPIGCNILAMWFLMKGAGFHLPVVAAMAVLLIIRVATVVPNSPGNLGSYQFFCYVALGLFGVSKGDAAAFSLLSFGIFTVPLLIGGAIAVVASGLKMGALVSVAEAAESKTQHPNEVVASSRT
jgi:uncharacterized protein (TIRG00374 family)